MPRKILPVTPITQQFDNSCWAACIRMVLAYDKLHITSDESLAKRFNVPANECQDISKLMTHANIFDSTDDEALLAPFEEVISEIDKGRPIIQCVNQKQIQPGANSDEGHYILIIGYDDVARTIMVIDPSSGKSMELKYDTPSLMVNGSRMYYTQPYYTQAGKPFSWVKD